MVKERDADPDDEGPNPALVQPSGAGRLILPVLVDGWQLECCGTPPAVGQHVSWQLNWTPEYGRMLRTDLSLLTEVNTLAGAGEEAWFALPGPIDPTADGAMPALATAGNVTVFVEAPQPSPEHLTLTGVLHEDHHVDVPESMPTTTGTILAVWLVSWVHEWDADAWRRVQGSARTHRVEKAPKWLATAVRHQEPNRSTEDVLVHLEADSPGNG